jgi:hypothetical protein
MSVSNGDVVHCVIEGQLLDGTIVQNRKRFKLDSAVTKSDSEILTALKTWVETLYGFLASYISVDASLEDGSADVIAWNGTKGIWEVTYNIGDYSPLDTFSGSGDDLPNQCSAFVIGNTSRPKTKGKIFAWPFTEASQADGILVAGALTALGNFAGQYISDQPVGGDDLLSGVVRELVNAWYDFSSADYDDVIGTQRRRRRGVGF